MSVIEPEVTLDDLHRASVEVEKPEVDTDNVYRVVAGKKVLFKRQVIVTKVVEQKILPTKHLVKIKRVPKQIIFRKTTITKRVRGEDAT